MTAQVKTTLDDIKATIRHIRDPLTTKSDDWQATADQWLVEFRHDAGFFTVDYYTGSGHRKNTARGSIAKVPKIKDVIHSLYMDSMAADENFHDWCSNFGYDDDSIKALNTYKECLNQAVKLRQLGLERAYLDKLFENY